MPGESASRFVLRYVSEPWRRGVVMATSPRPPARPDPPPRGRPWPIRTTRSGVTVMPATRIVPAMAVPRARAEIGHAAGQARDLALLTFRETRLHDVDRGRQHHAETEANEEQAWCERPGCRRSVDQQEQDSDACDGDERIQRGSESAAHAASRGAQRRARRPESRRVAAVKMTPVWIAS